MKDISEFEKDYTDGVKKIEDDLGTTMVKIGMDALGMIKTRVIQTGKDAKGEDFKPYSTKPMKAWCGTMTTGACGAAQGKYKRKKPKNSKKPLVSFTLKRGYEEFRELHNRRIDIVDFSFFNDMWNNISIRSSSSDHDRGTVILGAELDKEKKKLSGNTARNIKKGGNEILDLSEAEINSLKEMFLQPILNVFK